MNAGILTVTVELEISFCLKNGEDVASYVENKISNLDTELLFEEDGIEIQDLRVKSIDDIHKIGFNVPERVN